MSQICPNSTSSKHVMNLATSRTLPLLVKTFRNKLIGAVLIGMVVTQTAWAAGHGPSRGNHADAVRFGQVANRRLDGYSSTAPF
jgi:hypothetical protein